MAVYCGVCGERLLDATENYGCFQVNSDFIGWNSDSKGRPVLEDSCGSCSNELRAVITKAANEIVTTCLARLDKRRAELKTARDRHALYEMERAKFDAQWMRNHSK